MINKQVGNGKIEWEKDITKSHTKPINCQFYRTPRISFLFQINFCLSTYELQSLMEYGYWLLQNKWAFTFVCPHIYINTYVVQNTELIKGDSFFLANSIIECIVLSLNRFLSMLYWWFGIASHKYIITIFSSNHFHYLIHKIKTKYLLNVYF